MAVASPESVGLSSERLGLMAAHFAAEAKAKAAPGYVMIVARHGKVVFSAATGFRDIEAGLPMTLDTKFRIASMTKPVTSAAIMMLVEDGRIHLHDPVARYLPEFAEMRVATGFDDKGDPTTEPAKRAITIEDLLTHTSGLGYVFDRKTPLGKIWSQAGFTPARDLAEFTKKIASLPLYFHPGERFFYSFSDDVLGRVIEVVSGEAFDQFLAHRLFIPLGMKATSFHLTQSEMPGLATIYRRDPQGGLERRDTPLAGNLTDPNLPPSGGGGLVSTVPDYLRFAQMMANGGSFGGKRYLSPVTVAQMTRNRLKPNSQEEFWGANSAGLGYGLGLGVITDSGRTPYLSSDGDFAWGGLFDTQWVASPRTGIVAIIMTQMDPTGDKEPKRTSVDFRNMLFSAIISTDSAKQPSAR
jgi:CubicO group peptidase (beta-lactamase class C family)